MKNFHALRFVVPCRLFALVLASWLVAIDDSHSQIISLYQFDGNTTDTVRGPSANATLVTGTEVYTAGKVGQAYNFNGSTMLKAPQAGAGLSAFSISSWVNFSQRTQWATIVKNWGDFVRGAYHLGLNYDEFKISNYLGTDVPPGQYGVVSGTLTTNAWYHVGVTIGSTLTQTLYIDGVAVASGRAAGALNNNYPNMSMGAKLADNQINPAPVFPGWLNGFLDELTFFNTELTPGQITSIYTNGLAGVSVTNLGFAYDPYVDPKAPTFYWKTNVVGNWTTGANWSSNTVPNATDTAYIDHGGTSSVTSLSEVASLVIGSTNGAVGGTLSLATGGVLTAASVSVGGSNGLVVFNGGRLETPTITFSNTNAAIVFNQAGELTVTSAISGEGRLRQLGAGTTTVLGANTFTGGTVISNGALLIGEAGSLGAGAVTFSGDGALSFGDNMTFTNGISTTTAAAGFEVDKLTTVALTGGISGTGGIAKTGAGDLVFSNANTYSGTTAINDGTLSLAGANGSLGAGAVTNNGILSIDRSNAMTLSNAMSGSGFLVKNSATTLTVTGDLTHTGGTEINAGTVRVGDGGSTGSLGTGGSIANKGSLVFNRSDDGLVVSGNIAGTGTVVQAGAGTTTLSGTKTTYSGATTITNGVLRAGANGALSANSVYTLNGGVLDPGAATNSINFLDILSGTNTQTNGSLTVTRPNDESIRLARDAGSTATYNLEGGELRSGFSANLQVGWNGTATFNQSGGTNSIGGFLVMGRWAGSAGTYNLLAGLLQQRESARFSIIGEVGTGTMNVSGTGVFSNASAVRVGLAGGLGTMSFSNNGQLIAPGIIFGANVGNRVIFNLAYNTNFMAPISGTGAVIKDGTSTLTLLGANSYTRGTMVNNGVVVAAGTLANNVNNAVTVESLGTFIFSANNVFASVDATIATPIVINGGTVLNTNSTTNALGAVTLNGGTLQSATGSVFALKGSVTVNSNSTISGPGGLRLGSGAVQSTTFNVTNGAALAVDGVLADGSKTGQAATQASSLVKAGGGTMVLAGDNTYSGTTTINGGTLQVGTNGTTGKLGTGDVENNGLLVLNRSDAITVDNNISGTGALTKQGNGTATITGENSYTGATTIKSGTLALNGTHTNGLTYTVQTNAVFTGTGSTTSSIMVEGGGIITPGAKAGDVLTVGGLQLNTGGTLNVFLNGASTSLLDVNGDVTLGGGVNFITGADLLTASLYTFVSHTGIRTGEFGFTNALPTNYGLLYGDDGTIFLRLTNVNVNVGVNFNEGNAVITGGTLPFEVAVVNESGSQITVTGTNGLNTAGSLTPTPVETGANTNLAGLSWSGTNIGTNNGSFDVFYSGITNPVAVSVAVYDHARGSLTTGNITNLNAIVGYTNPLSGTVTVSNASGFRVDLATASTSINTNLTFKEAEGIGAGSSGNLTVNLANQAAGVFTNEVTVTFGDDSTLNGRDTNLGTTNFAVSGTIFDHALGSVGTNTIVFAPVHSGYTTPLTNNKLTVSNSHTSLRVDLGVANDNADVFLLIDPVAGIAQGASTNLAVVLETGRDPGKFTNNVTLTFFDDSALAGASTNVGTTDIVITGYVYSGQGVWTNSGSGEWTNFDSWEVLGGTPGLDGTLSVNDTATFGDAGSGTVVLNTNASLLAVTFSNSANSYTVQGTGTLTLAESLGTAPSLATTAGSHTISNAVNVVGDLQLQTTGELLLAGHVSGGSLQHVGAGTTTLAGSNSFAGGLGISNGQVILSNAAATGTGAISLLAREEERVAVPQLMLGASGLTISNAINLPTAALDPTDPNRHLLMAAIKMTGGTNQLAGAITGDGSLEVTGLGTMVITGTGNTYQGATRVSDGATLQVAGIDGTLGTADDFYGYIDIVDATFRYTGSTTNTGRELYMNEGSLSTIEVTDASANLTINPTSPGELNVDFVKAGAGTLTFGAGAIYDGEANITVAGGTFVTEAENSYTGNTIISNAATFKLGGAGQLGSGDYAGNITNEGSFVLDTTADQTLSGVVSGTGSLSQSGTGTLTITAVNTYSGATTIGTGSALVVSGDGRLGTAAVTNDGSLVFDTFALAEQTLANTVSGSGTLTKIGDGLLTVSGSNTYAGKTTMEAGTLVTTTTTALGTGVVDLLGGTLKLESRLDIGALFWDGAATIAIANPGAGHFVNLSTNSLSLTNGINNFDLTGFSLTSTPVALMSSANMSSFSTDLFGALGVTNYTLLVSNSTLYISLTVPPPPSDLIATTAGTFVTTPTNNYANVVYEPTGKLTISNGAGATISNAVVMSNNSTTTVNGAFTAPLFTVQSGSTLGGAGTVNGAVIVGGTYAPGTNVAGGTLTQNGNLTFESGGSLLWTLYQNTNSGPGVNFSVPVALGGNSLSVSTNSEFLILFDSAVNSSNSFWRASPEDPMNSWTVMTGTDLDDGLKFRPAWAAGSQTNGFKLKNFFFSVTNDSLVLNWAPGLIVFPEDDQFDPGDNEYPWISYEPNGNLFIPADVNVIIDDPVVMSNSSTTIVNGQFTSTVGSFTVMNGSAVGGIGTINGNLVNNGLVSPGNSPGTLSIGGNFTQTSSGSFLLEAGSLSVFDRLNVTGTAALAGNLTATGFGGYTLSVGDRYQFLTADGGISGTFDTITMPAGLRGSFLISGVNNSLGTLLIAPSTYTSMATTPNQFNVAQALDSFIGAGGDRGTVSAALDTLTAAQYPAAFEQMLPNAYASLPNMAFNTANALNSGMFQRLWVIRVNGKGFSAGGMNLTPMQAEMGGTDDMGAFAINPSKDTKWGTFVDGNGIFANGGDVNYLQNYRSQSGGVSTGASYAWNGNLSTGVYVGYQGLQAEYDNGRTIDNAVRFGVFGTYDIDNFYVNALVGGAYHGYTVNRNIDFGGLNRTATGRPGAGEFDLALGTGYDFQAGDFTWGPFTTMQYTYLGVQGFTETGAGALNLDVDPYNSSSLLYTLGAQAAYNWKISKNVIVTPTIFAGWQHEFLQDSYQINSSFNTGGPTAPFNYNTGTPARDNFYGGVGVTVGIGDAWQATATYSSFVGGQNQNSQNLYLGLGYKF
jgi:autotransporter-associated beta strand protein